MPVRALLEQSLEERAFQKRILRRQTLRTRTPRARSARRVLHVLGRLGMHAVLSLYALAVLLPLLIMVINSFKTTREIFLTPFSPPASWSLQSYLEVWQRASFGVYFANSLWVSVTSVVLILVISSMAAYGLARYRFPGVDALRLYFLAGLMVPLRLGVVPLFLLIQRLGLLDSHWALILTYLANGIPFSIFLLSGFFRQLPKELEYAARIDGCTEFQIYRRVLLPLVRPALATVAIYNFVPIWNDFFFPLIFLRSDHLKTIPLGMTLFFGQHKIDWSLLFAGMTLASLPLLALYVLLSGHFIRGLTAGAIKG